MDAPKSPAPTPPGEPHDGLSHAERCALCGRDNGCRVAKGELYKGPCWCHHLVVPGPILSRLAEDQIDPACLCRSCLETVARLAREGQDSESILAEIHCLPTPGSARDSSTR